MFSFEKVTERDVDHVIMRAFAELPEFAALFLSCTPWQEARVTQIAHSLTDVQLGESDITITVEENGVRYGLLIENKIDADAMPEQYARYCRRGERGIKEQDYSDFAVFIAAPEKYLATNAEAQQYANKISYESMREVFAACNRAFDLEMIEKALTKSSTSHIVHEVPAITEFWKSLYAYSEQSPFRVKMYPVNGVKGARSSWPQFRVTLRGASLFFKSKQGVVDLEFAGKHMDSMRLKEELADMKFDRMHWITTGNSESLRIEVDSIDFNEKFDMCIERIDMMLAAVEELTDLAAKLNDCGFTV